MYLDFLLIFTVLILTVSGYKKGFTQMLISLVSFFLSIAVSLTFHTWITKSITEADIINKDYLSVTQEINTMFENEENVPIENAPYLASLTKVLDAKEGIIDFSALSEAISETINKLIIIIPLMLLTFLIFGIIIKIIRKFVHRFTTGIPVVHGIDSVLGCICGFLFGTTITAVIFGVIVILQFVPDLSFVREQFETSTIVLIINDFIF